MAVSVGRLDHDGSNHAVETIAALALPAAPPQVEPKRNGKPGPVEKASFPVLKWEALCDANEKFKRTWHHERDDLADDLSRYDLALSSVAAHAGWKDPELASLILTHREQHGGPDDIAKGSRADYIASTIRKARSKSPEPPETADKVPPHPPERTSDQEGQEESHERQEQDDGAPKIARICNEWAGLRKGTGKRHGDRITRVREHGEGSDAEYDLVLENGTTIEGVSLKDLWDPRAMERRITQAVKRPPPVYRTPSDWRPWAVAIIEAAQPDIASGTEEEELREWLSLFLQHTRDNTLKSAKNVDIDDQNDLFSVLSDNAGVFWGTDQKLYVQPPVFFAYVTRDLRQKATAKELRKRLSRAGFERPNNREGKLSARGKLKKTDEATVSFTRGFLASKPGFQV